MTEIFRSSLGVILLAFTIFAPLSACGAQNVPAERRFSSTSVKIEAEPEVLIAALRGFAESEGFSFSVRRDRPDPRGIVIYMAKPNMHIIGSNPFVMSDFKFDVYRDRYNNSASEAELRDMTSRLKEKLLSIHGARIQNL